MSDVTGWLKFPAWSSMNPKTAYEAPGQGERAVAQLTPTDAAAAFGLGRVEAVGASLGVVVVAALAAVPLNEDDPVVVDVAVARVEDLDLELGLLVQNPGHTLGVAELREPVTGVVGKRHFEAVRAAAGRGVLGVRAQGTERREHERRGEEMNRRFAIHGQHGTSRRAIFARFVPG